MQGALVQRYLGNKSPITNEITSIVRRYAKPGDLVFDAFSGSLAVSSALRSAGFRIACNDINHFSWLCAKAYFSSATMPRPSWKPTAKRVPPEVAWQEVLDELTRPYGRSVPRRFQRTDFFDHYCEEGSKSAFTSQRGLSGRRRFFSAENAKLIDRALTRIRYWHRGGQLDEQTRCILTAALISGIEKVSNTQGTYHDFPRQFIDPRALKPLVVKVPPLDIFSGSPTSYIGRGEDTLSYVKKVPRHRVMYVDPPYNFRQYTSYYFMLNLISMHAEIDDLDSYFADVQFVRGQNMTGDFKSTFCNRSSFIPALTTLVQRAKTDYVVLSYFDGRNHWGAFKSRKAETKGRELIEEFFQSDIFVPGSFECLPVRRLNYQSYGGHTAKEIQEFLFVGAKAMSPARERNLGGVRGLDRNRAGSPRSGVAGKHRH